MAHVKTTTVSNGVDMELLQETVRAIQKDPSLGQCKFRVRNQWLRGGRNRTTVKAFHGMGQEVQHKQEFRMEADEPPSLGGTDEGANPVEHLLNALAACVTTSMVAHAAVRGIEVEAVESQIEGDIDLRGFLGLNEKVPKGYTNIRMRFKVKAAPEAIEKLKDLACYSPVYNTIVDGAQVDIAVEQA